jgi:hypothetical protein
MPTSAVAMLSRRIIRRMWPTWPPMAMRMPISGVRWLTT